MELVNGILDMSKIEAGEGWRHIVRSTLENVFKIDLIKLLYGLAVTGFMWDPSGAAPTRVTEPASCP